MTFSLLGISDICKMSIAVVLVKNVLLLVPTEKTSLHAWLIKAWLSVERLFPVECNTRKDMGNGHKGRCSSCIVIKQTILKFSHSSYMVIILHSLKTLLSLQLLSHLTISKFYQHATWNFFGLVILLNFFGK